MPYHLFMYIAFKKKQGRPQFILRESCVVDEKLTFRDLFHLGPDPSFFIKYPGGNAFYFDEAMEDALTDAGAGYDSEELETIFWPWIRTDIRRAIETFRNRGRSASGPKLTDRQKQQIASRVHPFDKRRRHFLKFGNMDQGPLMNMPVTLFKDMIDQSRDEIEQYFLQQEFRLKAHELKSYVYTVFDLQRFFSSFMAKKMPHVLDQEKVEACFIDELCRLNQTLFDKKDCLDDYMIRYAIMFFDYAFADTALLDDLARDFMARHRFFKPGPPQPVSTRNALKVFKLTKTEFKALDKRRLTRLYRKLARAVHPDTGGSHENFVELNNAYESLLAKLL